MVKKTYVQYNLTKESSLEMCKFVTVIHICEAHFSGNLRRKLYSFFNQGAGCTGDPNYIGFIDRHTPAFVISILRIYRWDFIPVGFLHGKGSREILGTDMSFA